MSTLNTWASLKPNGYNKHDWHWLIGKLREKYTSSVIGGCLGVGD
jgi:hypothetical protein